MILAVRACIALSGITSRTRQTHTTRGPATEGGMRVESRADVAPIRDPARRASSRTMGLAAELARYAFAAGRGLTHVARGMGLAPAASPPTGDASRAGDLQPAHSGRIGQRPWCAPGWGSIAG